MPGRWWTIFGISVESTAPESGTGAPGDSARLRAADRSVESLLQQPKVIPKGLRSFDAKDADYYLSLVPGPRDRHGLPESIRQWKTRIETTDATEAFAVGLLYGPSGCGKSSLVRAGLLPRLSPNVRVIYLEATADDTEAHLHNRIRQQFFPGWARRQPGGRSGGSSRRAESGPRRETAAGD